MMSMKTFVAVAALVALSVPAQAGLFGRHKGCGASKCCDCAPTCQPDCCKPTIVRPCHTNLYNYQRTCAKPFNCCDDNCCPNGGCAPANNGACDNNGNGCLNGGNGCAPACTGAACAPSCSANANACHNNGNGCLNGNACCHNGNGDHCCPENTCAAPCDNTCAAPCDDDCCPCVDPCEIAELIYQSQTACYARHRRKAIHRLGDRYDCRCNPEIMSAFIYALNDAHQAVRRKAADEIGDQLRKNPCCCSPCVVAALTCALADCDRGVRRQAEQALRQCGYDIVDGCCDDECCDTGCTGNGCTGHACAPVGVPVSVPAAQPVESNDAAPAPPAEGDRAYFPQRLPQQQSARPAALRNSLSNLFSLVD